jgi:hypothetical protein
MRHRGFVARSAGTLTSGFAIPRTSKSRQEVTGSGKVNPRAPQSFGALGIGSRGTKVFDIASGEVAIE